jgi:hypothetical protein
MRMSGELGLRQSPTVDHEPQALAARAVHPHGGRGAVRGHRDVAPPPEVDRGEHRRRQRLTRGLEHALGVDEGHRVAHARRQVAQLVVQAVSVVLDRPRHLAHVGECESVPPLQQLPAGAGQGHRPFNVQEGEPYPVRDREAAVPQLGRAGDGEAGETAISHPAKKGVDLPGRDGRRDREHGQRIDRLVRQVLLGGFDHGAPPHDVPTRDQRHYAVLRMLEERRQPEVGVHRCSSRPSSP